MENTTKIAEMQMSERAKPKKSTRAEKMNKINRLATMLGIGAFDGVISIAALSGLFKLENAFILAVLFMAGPGAILTALFFDGTMKERMFAALFAGLIATTIVVLAAGIGTKALGFFNLNILKVAGGIAILFIGLLIMGLKINDKLPMVIIFVGLIVAAVWRS
jgi:hypothetical protein